MFFKCLVFLLAVVKAELLCGLPVKSLADAEVAVLKFLERGCRNVVLTMGANGVVFASAVDEKMLHFPAKQVDVIDSTVRHDAIFMVYNIHPHTFLYFCFVGCW